MHLQERVFSKRENASSAFSTAAIVFLVCFVVDAPAGLLVLVSLMGGAVGWLVRSVVVFVSGFFLSLITWILIALLAGILVPTYSISGRVVLVSALIMTVVFALLSRTFFQMDNESGLMIPLLPLLAIFVYLTSPGRSWTSENAFGALVRNGEDNAAWLIALSRSVVNGETRLSVDSGTSGGPGTGVLINFVRQLMSSIGETNLVSSADNGLVLVRSYVFIAIVLAVVWVLVASKMLQHRDLLTQGLFGLVAGVVSYIFTMGLAAVGHYSAVVAVLFLSAAVYFAVMTQALQTWTVWLSRGFVFTALIAAGQSWFPLTGLAFVFAGIIVVFLVSPYVQKRPTTKQLQMGALGLIGIVVFSYISYTRLFPSFLQNVTSLDFITYNLTLAGGYSTVNAWLVILSFTVVLWWAFASVHSDTHAQQALVVALIFPIVGMFTWSYFLPPFTPQYGAWKYLYIGAAVLAPFAVIVAGALLPLRITSGVMRVVPVVLILFVALFSPPWNNIRWTDQVKSDDYAWVDPIVRELRESPTRPVGCLATAKNDSGLNYIAYLCSRMSMGLGGFNDGVHRVWTAANICTVGVEQASEYFTQSFQRNFTVILFDGTRTSSFAECQAPSIGAPNGWLTPFNWSAIRKLDPNGTVVEIPATKPIEE